MDHYVPRIMHQFIPQPDYIAPKDGPLFLRTSDELETTISHVLMEKELIGGN